MQRIRALLARYDQAIWIRVLGTILTTFAGFMVRPFLALYLFDQLGNNLIAATLVIGLQPLTGMIASLYGGGLADRYGRKPLMVAALVIESFSMLGYIWADSLVSFATLTIINGIGASLFWPAASAQVADVVPEDRRSEVYALLHTALNVGAAAGPLLGVMIYKMNPDIGFALCAAALLAYCLLLLWKVPETLPEDVRRRAAQAHLAPKEQQPRIRVREHKLLFLMTLVAIPISLLYTQVESVLPQHLKVNFDDALNTYALLLTINGTMVVCTQLLIARYAERLPMKKVIIAAYLMLACTAFGYGFSTVFAFLVFAEIMFTLGEMLWGPQIQKAISIMAPEDLRGRYFSIFGLNWGVTGTFGPVLGATMFTHFGGDFWFAIVGVALIIGGFIQYRLVGKVASKQEPIPTSLNESPTAVL